MTAAGEARAGPDVAEASRAWTWPFALDCYDRRATLTEGERAALEKLDEQLWHPWPQRRTGPHWQRIDRLVRPLDAAMDAAWRPDTPHHRHAVVDAVGLVLLRCRQEGTAYWGWSEEDWVELAAPNVAQFRSSRPGRYIDGWAWSPARKHGSLGSRPPA